MADHHHPGRGVEQHPAGRFDVGPPSGRTGAELLPLVYRELRGLAGRYMRSERRDHTLQPTALVHEAYARLAAAGSRLWRGKTHFYAVAANQMRLVLLQHARAAAAKKRDRTRVVLRDELAVTMGASIDMIALDEALTRLEGLDPRRARVAELRIFAGMTFVEIGGVLHLSDRTVKRDWRFVRAWLEERLATSPRSVD